MLELLKVCCAILVSYHCVYGSPVCPSFSHLCNSITSAFFHHFAYLCPFAVFFQFSKCRCFLSGDWGEAQPTTVNFGTFWAQKSEF